MTQASETQVGRVVSLFRYPVKAMAAESLASADIGWNGIAGDRRWAFVRAGLERSGFPWLTIRQVPMMTRYRARLVNPELPETSDTVVTTPAGIDLDVLDPELAGELGHGARVIRQSRGIFDALPLSLISLQTIAALGEKAGLDFDARRFRPNIVVDCSGRGEFPEDGWVGKTIRLGAVRMRVDRRDKRCVVTNVDPDTSDRNPAVLRTITDQRESCLGVYGSTVDTGTLAVGDAVLISE